MSGIFEELYLSAFGKAAKISPTVHGVTLGPKAISTQTEYEYDLQSDISLEAITSTPKKNESVVPHSRRPRRKGPFVIKVKSEYGLMQSSLKAQVSRANLCDGDRIGRKIEENAKLQENAIADEINRLSIVFESTKTAFLLKEKAFLEKAYTFGPDEAEDKTYLNKAQNSYENTIQSTNAKNNSEILRNEQRQFCEMLINLQKAHRAEYKNLLETRKLCVDKVKLDTVLGPLLQKLRGVGGMFETMVGKARKGVLVMQDIKAAESIVKDIFDLHAVMRNEMEWINNEAWMREMKNQKEYEANEAILEMKRRDVQLRNDTLIQETRKEEQLRSKASEVEALAGEMRGKYDEQLKNEAIQSELRREEQLRREALDKEYKEKEALAEESRRQEQKRVEELAEELKKKEEERIRNEVVLSELRREEQLRREALEKEYKEKEALAEETKIKQERARSEALAQEIKKKEELKIQQDAEKESRLAEAQRKEKAKALSTSPLADCFDRQSFHRFSTLRQQLEDVEKTLEAFMADPKLKPFRFPLQKAVTMPVNAISSVSSEHMWDKYKRLHSLLSGKIVETGGGSRVNASEHPLGITFAKNLLAKSFVSQGYKSLSGKADTVFAVASVLVNLWVDFPDFGDLVLAHFHRKCPYLAPIFFPRQEGQSELEYYESLGYEISNREVEKQDSFLNRMQGIVRLYGAVIIAKPKGGKPHPLGMPEAWRWLAAVLNLPPRPYICPALIREFLIVAGHDLWSTYRSQFQKLLAYICQDYFPLLEKVTDSSFGGPSERLLLFLQKVIKEGIIAPPADRLPSNFW